MSTFWLETALKLWFTLHLDIEQSTRSSRGCVGILMVIIKMNSSESERGLKCYTAVTWDQPKTLLMRAEFQQERGNQVGHFAELLRIALTTLLLTYLLM